MYYLEADLDRPEAGLQICGTCPGDIDRGRTSLANLAIGEMYDRYADYRNITQAHEKIGSFLTSLSGAVCFDTAANLLIDKRFPIIEKTTRLKLMSVWDGFMEDTRVAASDEPLSSNPYAVQLQKRHRYNGLAHRVTPVDGQDYLIEEEVLGYFTDNKIFVPCTVIPNPSAPSEQDIAMSVKDLDSALSALLAE